MGDLIPSLYFVKLPPRSRRLSSTYFWYIQCTRNSTASVSNRTPPSAHRDQMQLTPWFLTAWQTSRRVFLSIVYICIINSLSSRLRVILTTVFVIKSCRRMPQPWHVDSLSLKYPFLLLKNLADSTPIPTRSSYRLRGLAALRTGIR